MKNLFQLFMKFVKLRRNYTENFNKIKEINERKMKDTHHELKKQLKPESKESSWN